MRAPRRPPKGEATADLLALRREVCRRLERLGRPPLRDRPGDAARIALFAEPENHVGEVALGHPVDDVRRRRPDRAHAHIQRAIFHEGKAPGGLVDLEARDADIEHDPVHARMPRLSGKRVHFPKPAEQGHKSRMNRCQRFRPHHRVQVTVDPDQLALGRLEDGLRVTAAAERPIHDHITISGRECFEHFGQHDGQMTRLSGWPDRRAR